MELEEVYNYIVFLYYDYYQKFISYPFHICDMHNCVKCEYGKGLQTMKYNNCNENCSSCELKKELIKRGYHKKCYALKKEICDKIYLAISGETAESFDIFKYQCIFDKFYYRDDYLRNNINSNDSFVTRIKVLVFSYIILLGNKYKEQQQPYFEAIINIFSKVVIDNKSNEYYKEFKDCYCKDDNVISFEEYGDIGLIIKDIKYLNYRYSYTYFGHFANNEYLNLFIDEQINKHFKSLENRFDFPDGF